jgi:hypothetical protein
MTRRQFDAISPGGPGRAAAARRTGSPGGEPAAQTRPDAIMRIAPGEDRRPRLAAPAVALNGVGGDRLAVSATSLLQLQRQYGNRYVQGVIGRAQADQVAEACRDRGQRIDPKMNERLGRALGADFSEVTVHTDRAADRLSQALDADAFTVGSHIFFRANRYNPSTPAGQRLMAHELAHVVQQGARIGPASALRLGPANDASEREADRVAADLPGGMGARPAAHPLTGPARAPSIQRKVYLGGKRLVQPPGGPDIGEAERSVNSMIADQPDRYFEDNQELYRYARRQTETIGYLAKKKAWIRINDDELLVLGKHHSQTTMEDVAAAVGTRRWAWEKYATVPRWVSRADLGNKPSAGQPETSQRIQELQEEGTGHEAESFIPKLWRGLEGFDFEKTPDLATEEISETEWRLFQSSIFAASVAGESMPVLYNAYHAHKKTLDLALSTNYSDRMKWGHDEGWEVVEKSVQALQDVIGPNVTKTMEADPMYGFFRQRWRPTEKVS